MEANGKTYIPQVGTAARIPCGEPHTEPSSVSPTVSGGGNYRSTQEVGNLDMENDKWQEKLEELINPFARSNSIRRTPPSTEKRQNHQSPQDDPTKNPEIEKSEDTKRTPTSDDRPKKRKKPSSPVALQLGEIQPSIELAKLKARTDELNTFTRGNKNVHKEIKKFAIEITSLVKQAVTKHKHDTYKIQELQKELQEYRETQECRYSKLDNELQELRKLYEERLEKIEANKGEKCYKCTKKPDQFDLNALEINKYEEFITAADLEWTEDSFLKVQIDHGDPFNGITENVVYFLDETKERQAGLGKRILNRYPEFEEGLKTKCKGGSYTTVKQRITYKTGDGNRTKEKNMSAFFYDPTKESGRTQCDVFHLCQELRNLSESYETRELTVVSPQAVRAENMRKILEATFHTTDFKVTLLTSKKNNDHKEKKRKVTEDNIILLDKAASYAETVKNIRENLRDSDTMEYIKGVRKTNSGKVLVRVTDKASKEKVINSLKEKCNIELHSMTKRKFLHIRDVDATAEVKDIREAIINTNLVSYQEQLEIKALRPMKNGNQTATIWMEESDCKKILDTQKLRVGLNICQLQERVEVLRCYRCWGYDHRATRCNGEDRSQKCRKCNGDYHKAKDCNAEPFCPHCEEKGHSAGSSSCRTFQKALKMARINLGRRKRVGYSQSSK